MDTNVPGVHVVPGFTRSYIIDGDEGVTLIDTGLPGRDGVVVEVLAGLGRSPADIRSIAITHSHSDHTGGASALKRSSRASVFASRDDAPAVSGEAPSVLPPMFDRLPFLKPLSRLAPGAEPVEVDHVVAEGQTGGLPEDLRVVDTPGHTPGHVSYLLDRHNGVMFVGDAAVATRLGTVKRGFFNAPTADIDASIRHLAEFEFETAFFGHSGRLTAGAAGAFRRCAAGLG